MGSTPTEVRVLDRAGHAREAEEDVLGEHFVDRVALLHPAADRPPDVGQLVGARRIVPVECATQTVDARHEGDRVVGLRVVVEHHRDDRVCHLTRIVLVVRGRRVAQTIERVVDGCRDARSGRRCRG